MTRQEINTLLRGAWVVHTRYGLCEFREVIRTFGDPQDIFGIIIRPLLPFCQARLRADSDSTVQDFMEDSVRRLTRYISTQRVTLPHHHGGAHHA